MLDLNPEIKPFVIIYIYMVEMKIQEGYTIKGIYIPTIVTIIYIIMYNNNYIIEINFTVNN